MAAARATRWFALATACIAALVLAGVFVRLFEPQLTESKSVLRELQREGRIVVLTRNAPTTYYIDRDGPTGYEYELTQALGQALGVDVEYKVYGTIGEVLDALRAGEGQIAAAGIPRSPQGEGDLQYGPDYKVIRQQVVCRRDGPKPANLAGLVNVSIEVPAKTQFEERLNALAAQLPGLTWRARSDIDTEAVLEDVARGDVDCAISASNLVAIYRRYHPELVVALELDGDQPLAWILPPNADRLVSFLDRWFAEDQQQEVIARLDERFYGHVDSFDFVDIARFRRRIATLLPDYRKTFEAASAQHDLSWTLIAAQAYQESHWDPGAVSPTGVKGLMMLTLPTAKLWGVSNREDSSESIEGGVKHLAWLMKQVPETVTGVDRVWFALAAYNVGLGHLLDARDLAVRLGKDPDAWKDMREVLPLLAKPEYYRKTRHGYARGYEPVVYVQRIRGYWDILKREFPEDAELHAANGTALRAAAD
ncbi:MAG: membrane-bound lytic murein transglycosylase MltF [Alphaproteobacteria bacterium]|nr:membrane-bound lytic murein transglycosylase MltF [Alphaproteobacteria bacterium]